MIVKIEGPDPREMGLYREKQEQCLREIIKKYTEIIENVDDSPYFSIDWIKKNIIRDKKI